MEEIQRAAEQQPEAKKKRWLLLILGGVAILAAAIVLTCSLSREPYEKNARNFVKAVLENDMEEVEALMEPGIYAFAGSSLNMGYAVEDYSLKITKTERLDSISLLEYNELLVHLGSERKMTQAFLVTICYEAKGEENEITVIVGKIKEEWKVITIA